VASLRRTARCRAQRKNRSATLPLAISETDHRRGSRLVLSHSEGTDFIWTVLGKFKNALRYGLTGDPIDAKEALRLRLINQVVPKEQLLEEVFRLVERIALVPPDTVKINLQKATSGYEMMGLAKAWSLNAELSALAQLTRREEFYRPLEETKNRGGLKAFCETRDAPFQPEPFGPRAKQRE